MRGSGKELLPTLRPPPASVLSAEQPRSSSLHSPAAGARGDAVASPARAATAAAPGKRCTLWLLQLLCSAGLTPPAPTNPLCPTPPQPDAPLGVGEHRPVTPNDAPSPDHKPPPTPLSFQELFRREGGPVLCLAGLVHPPAGDRCGIRTGGLRVRIDRFQLQPGEVRLLGTPGIIPYTSLCSTRGFEPLLSPLAPSTRFSPARRSVTPATPSCARSATRSARSGSSPTPAPTPR